MVFGANTTIVKREKYYRGYADDFILGFEKKEDVMRVMKVLPKRFEKYKLNLHPDKTKVVDLFTAFGQGDRSFDFLGFTHFIGKSRNGSPTASAKI